ncbi:MAG: flap endonuclease-1 [Methanobacteriota archaeon]|nr:MAG: flap endonuclease-1 [Euryarchaeota archaeon]
MGTNLAPIVDRETISIKTLGGRTLAFDGNSELYQFLAVIRLPDGRHLTDPWGRPTSHLAGLAFRTTRLIQEYNIKPVFVFDGKPPEQKKDEIDRRRALREKALEEYHTALSIGDYKKAFSKAVVTSKLTKEMVEDAKHLLTLLGVPWVQAPSEGEAQAAYMAIKGDVWGVCSKDYDTLLFGAPRLVRYLTFTGKEYFPSRGELKPLKPEIIELPKILGRLGITREQLVEIAILIGTDYNQGVRGVGAKNALQLIKKYGKIECLPKNMFAEPLEKKDVEKIKKLFLSPTTTDNYTTKFGNLDEEGLYKFLCDKKGFSQKRVDLLVERMKKFYSTNRATLQDWVAQN